MTKTTSELLADLNTIRTFEGKEPLAAWKKSRSDLEALLKTYENAPETEAEQEKRLMDALTDAVPNEADEVSQEDLEAAAEFHDKLKTPVSPAPETPAETPATVEKAKSPRGAIGVMVMDLLQTDMPYKDIVTKVRETYWDAKTTERSVASVAMDLRRDGIHVPPRRKPAAIKPLKAAQQPAEPFKPSH
jgi:hypothetical protein